MDLHVLGSHEHDLTMFGKYLEIDNSLSKIAKRFVLLNLFLTF